MGIFLKQDDKLFSSKEKFGILASKAISTTSSITQIFLNVLTVFDYASHLRDTWVILLISRL